MAVVNQASDLNAAPASVPFISATTDINPLDAIKKLRSVGGALSVQLALHGQLAKVEWAQEKTRLSKLLMAALLGVVFFLCANICIGVLLLTLGWQAGYLIPAVLALVGAYVLGAWFAWRRLQMLLALGAQAFAATRAELAADIALIRSKL